MLVWFFVIRRVDSAVSLTLVREQHFIRMIINYYYYYLQAALVKFRGCNSWEEVSQDALKERHILRQKLGQVGVPQRMDQHVRLVLIC